MKIFDSHLHIINKRFPLVENQGFIPEPFTVSDYKERIKDLNICGGAVISGSFQAFDQQYLFAALKELGTGYYGVANISEATSKKELQQLNETGVVGVRFNLKRGEAEVLKNMERLSIELFERYGWHTELYVDSRNLMHLSSKLKNLPPFSIDHLGLSKEGLKELYKWVEKGVKVKATGFGRLDFDPVPVMKRINSINPEALMFGTDLPSTRSKFPFSEKDIQLVKDHFSEDDQKRIFFKNGFAWYNRKIKDY